MKKKWLILFTSVYFSTYSFAQNKITKYCEVVTFEKGFSAGNIVTTISTGKVDSLFLPKDASLKSQLQKVTSFKNAPDVLNYMGLLGWSLVSTTSISTSGTNRFYFKKEFDPSELLTTKNH